MNRLPFSQHFGLKHQIYRVEGTSQRSLQWAWFQVTIRLHLSCDLGGQGANSRGREGDPRVELLRDLRGPFGCWSLWVLVTFLFLHRLLGIQIHHILAHS